MGEEERMVDTCEIFRSIGPRLFDSISCSRDPFFLFDIAIPSLHRVEIGVLHFRIARSNLTAIPSNRETVRFNRALFLAVTFVI